MTTDGGASWRFRLGGDGGGGRGQDPNDSNVMLATLGVYGGIWPFHRHRSTNAGVTWGDVNGGIGLASQWWLRVRNDLGNPVTWYTYGDEYVYRSTNGGFWTGMNGTATAFPHFVAELTASHVAVPNGTVYACLDSDVTNERLRVWDGSAFQERSNGLPTGVRVRKVATHPRKADWAFALMNGMGTPGQKVFRSTDRGITWGNITGNLPDLPLADLVAHPTDDDRLFLGTEMGAFRTTDGGTTWERWQSGLPEAAVITEMTFVDRWDEDGRFTIVMGTYGRGIWVRDVESDPTDVPDDELPGDGSPVGGPDIPRLLASSPNPFRTSTDVSFALPRESRVSLRVFDAGGRQVMLALDEDRRAGVHRVAIDGARLPTGTLFLRLETPDGAATRTITRIR
ncbi:MAG: hypothetical protein R3E12_19755 [Candidatus Eisenbacteria bacterium]